MNMEKEAPQEKQPKEAQTKNLRLLGQNKKDTDIYILKTRPNRVYIKRCSKLFEKG